MATRQPRYSNEEFEQRGTAIYERSIREKVEPDNIGKIVAIDIETGAYAIADRSVAAAKKLLKSHPEAQIFGIRIGYPTVHRFGVRARPSAK